MLHRGLKEMCGRSVGLGSVYALLIHVMRTCILLVLMPLLDSAVIAFIYACIGGSCLVNEQASGPTGHIADGA